MAQGTPIEATDATLEKIVKENSNVVVDVTAAWCMPCKVIAPHIDDLSKKYTGKVVFAKLDADKSPAKMREYAIMGVPTLLFFKNGRLVDTIIGAVPKSHIEEKVRKYL